MQQQIAWSIDVVRLLLARGELGDGLRALGDGVLGQLTRKNETDRSLDLAGGNCRLLRVRRKL